VCNSKGKHYEDEVDGRSVPSNDSILYVKQNGTFVPTSERWRPLPVTRWLQDSLQVALDHANEPVDTLKLVVQRHKEQATQ
jgi:hypothetical protein